MSRRCRGVSGGTEDSSERAAVLRRSKHQLGISNLAGGQQPAFDNDEVGEGKQRVQLGGVLGQAAVAQLAMAARPRSVMGSFCLCSCVDPEIQISARP
jgi:hypothetical protein